MDTPLETIDHIFQALCILDTKIDTLISNQNYIVSIV